MPRGKFVKLSLAIGPCHWALLMRALLGALLLQQLHLWHLGQNHVLRPPWAKRRTVPQFSRLHASPSRP